MKAYKYGRFGSPDELKCVEVANPVPKPAEILVRIKAVSINDWDLGFLQGEPFVNRLLNGVTKPKIQILGCDIAGRVEAVGAGVTRFRPGDEVYGDLSSCGFGGFAEYVCVPESALAPKPTTMSFEQAAAIPQAGMLAVQGLRDIGKLQPKQRLLINGAGGGVGTMGIQLAKLMGAAEVTGVDSTDKLELLRGLGFDNVIDYKQVDFTAEGKQYDLILDTKTDRPVAHYMRALAPGGVYVTVGGATPRLLATVLLRPWIRLTTPKDMRLVMLQANKDLSYINALFNEGKFKPVIDRPFNFDELPAALHYYASGQQKGKLVISIS
jgi:NADPH:quinone reductase-like Zn-dependent oxidoreductase